MPTLLDVNQAAAAAADAARDAAVNTAALRQNAARTAQQALVAATDALGNENAAGAALRAQLDDAPNPADAAVLVEQWEAHVIAARALGAAVLDAQLAATHAAAIAAAAAAAADRARRHAADAAAALGAAEARVTTWAEWRVTAGAFAANVLADRAAALIAARHAPAKAKVDAEIPAALQTIANAREAAALDDLAAARVALGDARQDLVDHLDTGGAADASTARALEFAAAEAELRAFSVALEPHLTALEASLIAIAESPPLSAAVLADIAAKAPVAAEADPEYAAQLDAWEAAVPDAAWRRLRALNAARRALDRYVAATAGAGDDPAEVVSRFDAAEDAHALALQAAAAYEATARERHAARTAADAALVARVALDDGFLLAALRGDR